MLNIAYRHLRAPLAHAGRCQSQCAADCPVLAFESALAEPVLQSEIEAARREEERFKALAEALNKGRDG